MASVERRTRGGRTFYVTRYRDGEEKQRSKNFTRKTDADRFAATVAADRVRGTYRDPDAGKQRFEPYAKAWLEAQTFDESTREAVGLRLRLHAFPVLGHKELRLLKPSTMQAWLRSLERLAPSYQRVIFVNVSSILNAAVDDELLAKNPCQAASVRTPKVEQRKVVPWTSAQVQAVRAGLPDRYAVVAVLAAGLGLRQGEVFGLSPIDVDFLRGVVHVRRQVKVYGNNKQAFALPKGRKVRQVPLPSSVRDALAAYLVAFPAKSVTLPWESLVGKPTTSPLILTSREGGAANRNYFNPKIWKPALVTAKIPPTRDNGCHALRHHYASVLLDGGESIKAVSEYLGHADAGFTLRTYTHLMPSSDERTRKAIDAAFSACVPDVYPGPETGSV